MPTEGYRTTWTDRVVLIPEDEQRLTHAVGPARRRGNGGRAVLRTGRPPVPKYPDRPQSVKQLVIAAGRKVGRPVQWREGSRPGTGRSGRKRRYSRFVALRIRPAGHEIRQTTDSPELPECRLLAG